MCMNPLEMTKTQELPGASGPLDPWPGLCPGPTGGPSGPLAPSSISGFSIFLTLTPEYI